MSPGVPQKEQLTDLNFGLENTCLDKVCPDDLRCAVVVRRNAWILCEKRFTETGNEHLGRKAERYKAEVELLLNALK